MTNNHLLISSGKLKRDSLAGQVAIITGAGGGIGYEAARALAWLGADVIIAEVNTSGKLAAKKINQEFDCEKALFIQTDVGDEHCVNRLEKKVFKKYKKVDIVLNNATVAKFGAVPDLPISVWDASYRVNLRGPVLLAKKFLPGMLKRNSGVFVSVTSEGLAYMGAYETFKSAQLHLARTIDAELEGTEVISFAIGPGLVPTATVQKSLPQLAQFNGKTVEEFEAMLKDHIISVEAAGVGFAAAIALAEKFRGQEIGVKQALIAAEIDLGEENVKVSKSKLTSDQVQQALLLCQEVRTTLIEQHKGWLERSIFERQWVLRDFKKHSGMPVEQWFEILEKLEYHLKESDLDSISQLYIPVIQLANYYIHLQELNKGYTKDQKQLEENIRIIQSWQITAEKLAALL